MIRFHRNKGFGPKTSLKISDWAQLTHLLGTANCLMAWGFWAPAEGSMLRANARDKLGYRELKKFLQPQNQKGPLRSPFPLIYLMQESFLLAFLVLPGL